MDARGEGARIERAHVDGALPGGTAELVLRIRRNRLVELGYGRLKRLGRNAAAFRQLGDGVAGEHHAGAHHVAEDLLGTAAQGSLFRVAEDEEQLIGLGQRAGSQNVAALILGYEALAFLVEVEGAVDIAGDTAAGNRVERHELDPLHAHEVRARGKAHGDAVAGRAFSVIGLHGLADIGPLAIILDAHLDVRAETAGRHDDALGRLHGHLLALGVGQDRAGHAAVFHDQLFRLGLQVQIDALSDGVRLQRSDDIRAGDVRGLMGAVPQRAHNGGHFVRPDNAVIRQPVEGIQRAGGQGADHVHVGDVVARVERLQRMPLGGIKEHGIAGGEVRVPLRLHLSLELRVRLAGVFLGEHFLHGFLERRGHRDVRLTFRVIGVERAAAAQGVAAHSRQLFNENDLRAVLRSGNRSGEARAARADDQHVGLAIGQNDLFFLSDFYRAQRLGVAAGLRHAVGHGIDDRVGAVGRARRSVNAQALVLDNRRGNLLKGGLTDTDGFRVRAHQHIGDGRLVEGDRHLHRAVIALRRGGVRARGIRQRRRDHAHGQQRSQSRSSEFLHNLFLLQ